MSKSGVPHEAPLPECFVSAKLYESYLWQGHCVTIGTRDFWQDEFDFHQDKALADRALEQMLLSPEEVLIEQMGRIIKRAAKEIGISELRSMTITQQNGLQIYLASEVSTQGMQYARQDGFISQDPYLAEVDSPFKNKWLFDRVARYRKSGRMARELVRYATLDKLLPGYLPASY